jgi:hypothetical protein
MRFNLRPAFFCLIVLTFFVSCKKGEDDPALSFRTRKARVVGDWTMKSGSTLETFYAGQSFTITTTCEEKSYTGTQEYFDSGYPRPFVQSFSGNYSYNLKFGKDGSFESTKVIGANKVIMKGTWNFIGKGENSKNKERMTITITNIDNGAGYISYTYTGNNSFYNYYGSNTLYTYKIKELRNKKMVISSDSYISTTRNLSDHSLKEEYVFEQ